MDISLNIFHRLYCKILISQLKYFPYNPRVLSFLGSGNFNCTSFYCVKMSLHQANKDKPRAQKCRHFCFSFDTHNYCPTCREAGKGDDPCVTFEAPYHICTSLSDEQLQKIQNRKRYLKKQKAETSSKDELDLLGEGDGDSFTGSNADLESAADKLFTSPPPSSTSRLQFFITKDPSQGCSSHPRYCFTKQNSKKSREIPG